MYIPEFGVRDVNLIILEANLPSVFIVQLLNQLMQVSI
jgi:hypothetical protein